MSDFPTPDQLELAQELYEALHTQHIWRAGGPATTIDGRTIDDYDEAAYEAGSNFALNWPADRYKDDARAIRTLARSGETGTVVYNILLGGWVLVSPVEGAGDA